MPYAYCYGRASTDKQALTENAQRSACEEYVSRVLVPKGFTPGGWFYDAETSGSTQLFERKKGLLLWAEVKKGDTVVVSKLDRAFRSTSDFVHTLDMLGSRGVSMNCLDIGMDSGTPIGRFVYTIMAAFAEMERNFIAQRTSAGMQQKLKEGKPISGNAPIGWKKIGKKAASYFVPDEDEREQVKRMVDMRRGGAAFEAIVNAMWNTRRTNGRRWNINSVIAAVKAADARFPKAFSRSRTHQTVAS